MLREAVIENRRLSASDINDILTRLNLPACTTSILRKATIHNLVYELQLATGEELILKVQMRVRGGPVCSESETMAILRQQTTIPITNRV